jgi:hypothetical protein
VLAEGTESTGRCLIRHRVRHADTSRIPATASRPGRPVRHSPLRTPGCIHTRPGTRHVWHYRCAGFRRQSDENHAPSFEMVLLCAGFHVFPLGFYFTRLPCIRLVDRNRRRWRTTSKYVTRTRAWNVEWLLET